MNSTELDPFTKILNFVCLHVHACYILATGLFR